MKGESTGLAAAASLEFALAEMAVAFEHETGRRFRTSFGSSGNLYRQIVQGAPFEIFLSADAGFARKVLEAGLAAKEGVDYAEGQMADADVRQRLAAIKEPFQDMRARVAALTYELDHTTDPDGKDSIRQDIEELKNGPFRVARSVEGGAAEDEAEELTADDLED